MKKKMYLRGKKEKRLMLNKDLDEVNYEAN